MSDIASSEIPTAIRAFVDATNAADTEAFVAAFTADATLDDWGRPFTGHDGIRSWNQTDNIGVQAHFDLVSVEPQDQPDSYLVTINVSSNRFNGTGPMIIRLRDGLIADLRIS